MEGSSVEAVVVEAMNTSDVTLYVAGIAYTINKDPEHI